MPKVLIVAAGDLSPLLGECVLWSHEVERLLTTSIEAAFEVGPSLVPSLVVVEAAPGRGGATLVRRLRAHAGLRRASIVAVAARDPLPEERELLEAGANLVLKGRVDPGRWDDALRRLMSVPRRLRLRLPVTLTVPEAGPRSCAGQVLDLSSRGVLVESEEALPSGGQVRLRFRLPGESEELEAEGEVVRAAPGSPGRWGLRFTRLDVMARIRIHQLLATVPLERGFGRYEPLGLLAEGSMGHVYRAFDPAAQRVVAIKTLRPELVQTGDREEALRLFRLEAQAAAALVHPNIVTIFDVGHDYFVMELVEGATLQALIRERGRIPPRELCALLRPVAEALDYAHGAGVIHRDIKPANIMVTGTGRPLVMDFGVAHFMAGPGPAADQLLGSPAYMAPEQVTGVGLGPQTDLFSLAVVAYEALTGCRAFEARSVGALLYAVVHTEPAPPSQLVPDLPAAFDEAFRRALAKDKRQRFATATDFVAALEAVLPEGAAAAPLAPLPANAPTETRPGLDTGGETLDLHSAVARRWRPIWAVALLLLVLSLIGLLPLLPGGRQPRAAPTASARLDITTVPDGAEVWLDGQLVGRTPLQLGGVPPGGHALRVERPDYAPADLSLMVPEGAQQLPLRFELRPLAASLSIESQPAQAWVRIDGENLGTTPLEGLRLAPGPHRVELERSGHRPWSERVELAPGESRRVAAQLERAPGRGPQGALERSGWVRLGDLVALGPGVTPPRKLSAEPAPYPEAARALRLEGTVEVELTVTESGQARDVRVVRSAGEPLDQALVQAVARWRYEPAESNGVKVKVRLREQQRFDLPGPVDAPRR